MDDEAGVEREAVVDDRVRVAARALAPLEQLDLVGARQRVRGPEAGNARSYHDPHLNRYVYEVDGRLST